MSPGTLRALELTARGRGAISVLRIEGQDALERVRRLSSGERLVPGAFALVHLRAPGGELLDEALVLVDSPGSLELHLHGSPVVVERVLAVLGARRTGAGVETLEERAEALLAGAASEAAARMLLDQSRGALRAELRELCELSGPELAERLGLFRSRGRVARALVRPPLVVLAGPVNAGKSTLFNALVGRERVLVDAAEGTTRDPVRERTQLGSYAVDLVDTAGERSLPEHEPSSGVERAGQGLARELCAGADLVLWLVPGRARAPEVLAAPARTRFLASRADEGGPGIPDAPAISALHAPLEACSTVSTVFHEALGLPLRPWRAGEGVPFSEELACELELWLEAGDEARTRAGLASWLERGSAG